MPFRMPSKVRELGAAFAVLAIYFLVLLAPLHQAAGLQRDLNTLGFTSLDTWSVCGQLAQSDDGSENSVAKCAASGIGKNELAALKPVLLDFAITRVATVVDYAVPQAAARPSRDWAIGQPRAPPASA